MKTLLPFTSPTYLRRLAKELNALPDGFYHEGTRYNRASVSSCGTYGGGPYMFRISRQADDGNPHNTQSRGLAGDGEKLVFSDAYGRSVCASRHPVR